MTTSKHPPLGNCPLCGVNMDLTGKAHDCRPRAPRVMVEASSPPVPTETPLIRASKTVTPAEVLKEFPAAPKSERKTPPADRRILSVRVDAALLKRMRLAVIEREMTVEAFIERAIEGALKKAGK